MDHKTLHKLTKIAVEKSKDDLENAIQKLKDFTYYGVNELSENVEELNTGLREGDDFKSEEYIIYDIGRVHRGLVDDMSEQIDKILNSIDIETDDNKGFFKLFMHIDKYSRMKGEENE